MKLTESQTTLLEDIAKSYKDTSDEHEFLNKVIQLSEQGVNVEQALKENHSIILTEGE